MIRRKFLIILCLAFIINILFLNITFAAENINKLNAIITAEEVVYTRLFLDIRI